MLKALIFDCDGVLVDTERDGHRVAFNRAFELFNIDAHWDVPLYGELLLVAGGKERMRAYFDRFGWPENAQGDEAGEGLIKAPHKEKTRIGSEMIPAGELPLRAGISRIVDEAIAAGVKLGVCTTSNPAFIDAVLDLFGPERKAKFAFVHAGDCVSRKKPDPEIYELAKTSLGVGADGPAPHECIVVEDSRNGLLAAMGAELPTLVTTSTYTTEEDYTVDVKVVPELGDTPGATITLKDMEELAAATRQAA